MTRRRPAGAIIGLALLIGLTVAVRGRGPIWFDLLVTRGLQDAPRLEGVMRSASVVGSQLGLIMVAGSIIGLLALRKRFRAVAAVVATAMVEVTLVVLRSITNRPRPTGDLVAVLTDAPGTSFPSGHAAEAAVLGVVVVGVIAASTRVRMAASLLAGAGVLLSGVSRVYLGAHWATDVVGGWILGVITGWLILWRFGPTRR